MEKRRAGQRAKALAWLAAEKPAVLDEAVAARMLAALPGLSERLLREVWRGCGLPMTPMVEGVRQESLAELARSLDGLGREYEAGDARRRLAVRRVVITARRHAEWVAANPRVAAEKRALKVEMGLWLRVWLENPGVFGAWVELRKERAHV
ncbi:MAG TPA: hypothetical protein VGK29_25525 [Paludibaculum sp.]